jgi:Flp pilus assembly protein TadD
VIRRLGIVFVSVVTVACGGSTKQAAAPTLARVDNAALGQMVQGVESAKKPENDDGAIEHFQAAILRDPQLWEARYDLGVLFAERNRLDDAETELADAARLAPNAEDVALALAEVRRRRGNPGAAADGLEPFVKAYPDAISARIALVAMHR